MQTIEAIKAFSQWRSFKVKKETTVSYFRELRNFCLFLRNPDVESIALEHVMDYLQGMADLEWDPNSFTTKCMALRKFFEFCRLRKWTLLDENLIPIPAKEYKIPRVATEDSYEKLLDAVPENNNPKHIRNRAIIHLLWDTGARNTEICSLNVKDLDFQRNYAVIHTLKSKGRRPIREIFWTDKTSETLRVWLKKREHLAKIMNYIDPEALFVSVGASVNNTCGKRLSNKGVGEMLRRYSNRAGIPTMNAHSFRHHMGHDIAKKASAVDVQNILGHSSLASSSIYTMMYGKELEEQYRKIKGS